MKTHKLKAEFIDYLRGGAKPREAWRVGVEIELFGFDEANHQRLDNAQVQSVLRRLAKSEHDLVFENDLLVEMHTPDGGKWTVEPGGQIEFSSAPRGNLSEIESDLQSNFANLRQVSAELNFMFLAIGFDPLRTIDEQHWFMKPRYKLMKPYLAARGSRAWDMMTRTCSVQVNLDYVDEPNLIKKFIVGNRLAPTVAAIFANSPFADGKASGYKSMRVAAWNETDSHRCSMSPLALKDEFSLEDFVEYALDVPMLFVRKNGRYLENFTGKTFREFLANEEIEPTLGDFQDHLTTIFTDARLKSYLELRSADCNNLEYMLAAAALWKGLFYDEAALHEALMIAPKMSATEYCALQQCVAKNGLQAVSSNVKVLDLAKEIVKIATRGLNRIDPDEVKFLNILQQRILIQEKCPADILLENWCGNLENVFKLTVI